MQKREIERAVNILTENFGEKVARKLLLVAPMVSADAEDKKRMRDIITRENGRVPGLVPGYIFRATDLLEYYMFDADFVGASKRPGKPVDGFYSTGEYDPIGPENLRLADAAAVDENAECISLQKAVDAIIKAETEPRYRRW